MGCTRLDNKSTEIKSSDSSTCYDQIMIHMGSFKSRIKCLKQNRILSYLCLKFPSKNINIGKSSQLLQKFSSIYRKINKLCLWLQPFTTHQGRKYEFVPQSLRDNHISCPLTTLVEGKTIKSSRGLESHKYELYVQNHEKFQLPPF